MVQKKINDPYCSELENLFGAYYNNMWAEINKSRGLSDVHNYKHPLNDLLERETISDIGDRIEALNHLIDLSLSELELESLLRKEFQAAVLPPYWGLTYTQWLVEVRDYLKAGLKNK